MIPIDEDGPAAKFDPLTTLCRLEYNNEIFFSELSLNSIIIILNIALYQKKKKGGKDHLFNTI